MTVTPLLPTQVEDAAFLASSRHRHRALWNDPGTGKTLTAIAALETLGLPRTIIIGPAIAVSMWRDTLLHEVALAPHEVVTIRSTRVPPKGGWRVAVMSYDIARRLGWKWFNDPLNRADVAIYDEADALNRWDSQRTRLLYTLLPDIFDRVWPLTGTPVRGYADGLWPIMHGLWRDRLDMLRIRNRDAFERRFCTVERVYGVRSVRPVFRVSGNKPEELQLLRDLILGGIDGVPALAVRRTIDEVVAFLPPVTQRRYEVPLATPIDPLPPDWEERLEEMIRKGISDDEHVSTALRQIGVAKAPAVADYVRQEGRLPLVLFYWHRDVGAALKAAFKGDGYRIGQIDGATPWRERDEQMEAFNTGGIDILLGQVQSLGAVANLQALCSHVIFAEGSFSPRDMRQALARVWRMGQTQHVQVDHLDGDHDLERRKIEIQRTKQRGQDILTGDDEESAA